MNGIIFPAENHVVNPCSQYSANRAEKKYIQHFAYVHVPCVRAPPAVQSGEYEAESYYYPVPFNWVIAAAYTEFTENGRYRECMFKTRERDFYGVLKKFQMKNPPDIIFKKLYHNKTLYSTIIKLIKYFQKISRRSLYFNIKNAFFTVFLLRKRFRFFKNYGIWGGNGSKPQGKA